MSTIGADAAPVLETHAGFDVDGVQLRVRHDFGTAVIDHRGLFRNAGA